MQLKFLTSDIAYTTTHNIKIVSPKKPDKLKLRTKKLKEKKRKDKPMSKHETLNFLSHLNFLMSPKSSSYSIHNLPL